MRLRILIILLILVLIIGPGGTVGAERKPIQLTLLCGVIGGAWYPLGASIASIFNEELVPSNAEPGGGVSNLINIDQRKAEIGFTMGVAPSLAKKGETPFEKPYTNVAGIAVLFPNLAHIMVHGGSEVKSFEDLKGKPFASQPIGNTTQVGFSRILEAIGMSEDDLLIERGSQAEGAALVRDRHVVGLVTFNTTPASAVLELTTGVKMRFLSIDDEHLVRIEALGEGLRRCILPAGTYPGQDEPVPTIATDTIVIVPKDMPKEEVYWITRILVENLDRLAATHAFMKGITAEDMAKVIGVPIHPGAQEFYEDYLQQ